YIAEACKPSVYGCYHSIAVLHFLHNIFRGSSGNTRTSLYGRSVDGFTNFFCKFVVLFVSYYNRYIHFSTNRNTLIYDQEMKQGKAEPGGPDHSDIADLTA